MYAITFVRTRWGRGTAGLLVALAFGGLVAARSVRAPSAACQRGAVAPAPTAVVLVELGDPSLDLAHFIDADRPGGFAARVTPLTTRPAGVTGDLAAWRRLEVAMDDVAVQALASRLRQLPPIADAVVVRSPR